MLVLQRQPPHKTLFGSGTHTRTTYVPWRCLSALPLRAVYPALLEVAWGSPRPTLRALLALLQTEADSFLYVSILRFKLCIRCGVCVCVWWCLRELNLSNPNTTARARTHAQASCCQRTFTRTFYPGGHVAHDSQISKTIILIHQRKPSCDDCALSAPLPSSQWLQSELANRGQRCST